MFWFYGYSYDSRFGFDRLIGRIRRGGYFVGRGRDFVGRLGRIDFTRGRVVVVSKRGDNSSGFVCFYCIGLIRGVYSIVVGIGLLVMMKLLVLLVYYLSDVYVTFRFLNSIFEIRFSFSFLFCGGDGAFEFRFMFDTFDFAVNVFFIGFDFLCFININLIIF